MSCPRTYPTPSSISPIKNWTCSLRRLSKRRSGEAECPRALRQRPVAKRSSRSSDGRQGEMAAVSLTRGQINAVRAAFKAGIKPSLISRQFGISQSDVRKVLASDAATQEGA